jgi:hypothetical protein
VDDRSHRLSLPRIGNTKDLDQGLASWELEHPPVGQSNLNGRPQFGALDRTFCGCAISGTGGAMCVHG